MVLDKVVNENFNFSVENGGRTHYFMRERCLIEGDWGYSAEDMEGSFKLNFITPKVWWNGHFVQTGLEYPITFKELQLQEDK